MNEMKTAIEIINSRLDQAEDRISETEGRNLKLLSLEWTKKKQEKRVRKAYMIHKTTSKEPICKLLEFQKEKRRKKGRREQRIYLKK